MAIKGESYERDTMYPQFLMENRSSANGGTEGAPWPHERRCREEDVAADEAVLAQGKMKQRAKEA